MLIISEVVRLIKILIEFSILIYYIGSYKIILNVLFYLIHQWNRISGF